jgi:hypothetical protein
MRIVHFVSTHILLFQCLCYFSVILVWVGPVDVPGPSRGAALQFAAAFCSPRCLDVNCFVLPQVLPFTTCEAGHPSLSHTTSHHITSHCPQPRPAAKAAGVAAIACVPDTSDQDADQLAPASTAACL